MTLDDSRMKLSAEKRTGLPATDVYRFGRVDKLMDALERHYKKKRRAK